VALLISNQMKIFLKHFFCAIMRCDPDCDILHVYYFFCIALRTICDLNMGECSLVFSFSILFLSLLLSFYFFFFFKFPFSVSFSFSSLSFYFLFLFLSPLEVSVFCFYFMFQKVLSYMSSYE